MDISKTAFTIFHLENNEREELYQFSRKVLLEHFDELDSPTIYFKDSSDLEAFYGQNDIVFNRGGFYGTGWQLGEIGLWAGNYVALQNFINSDYDHLLLVEDDTIIDHEFVKNLEKPLSELPDDWDIFFIFTQEHEKTAQIALKEQGADDFMSKIIPDKSFISKAFQRISTGCYLVNKESSRKILDLANKLICSPLDTFLLEDSGLANYSLRADVPNICWNDNRFVSQIQDGNRHLFSFFPNYDMLENTSADMI